MWCFFFLHYIRIAGIYLLDGSITEMKIKSNVENYDVIMVVRLRTLKYYTNMHLEMKTSKKKPINCCLNAASSLTPI